MKVTLNKEGTAFYDEDGNEVEVQFVRKTPEGEPVALDVKLDQTRGLFGQAAVDAAVQKRVNERKSELAEENKALKKQLEDERAAHDTDPEEVERLKKALAANEAQQAETEEMVRQAKRNAKRETESAQREAKIWEGKATRLQRELRQRKLGDEVRDAAWRLGFHSAEQAQAILNSGQYGVAYEPVLDAEGKPTGEEKIVVTVHATEEGANGEKTPVTKQVAVAEAMEHLAETQKNLIQADPARNSGVGVGRRTYLPGQVPAKNSEIAKMSGRAQLDLAMQAERESRRAR